MNNPSVGCADSSPYTGEPFPFPVYLLFPDARKVSPVILSAAKDLKLH